MKKYSKILSIVLIITIALVALQNSVFATGLEEILNGDNEIVNIEEITIEPVNESNNNNNNNDTTTTNNDTNTNNPSDKATNDSIANVEASSQANENLPKTGITGDIAIVAFVVVCAGAAIYAYTRVKNYNV